MFQSTPLCEGRPCQHHHLKLESVFQSTPLCEGRPLFLNSCDLQASFNPRPYARGDCIPPLTSLGIIVSIHAPMRGATCSSSAYNTFSIRFQSTPLCEGRPLIEFELKPNKRFNPRPYARGDVNDGREYFSSLLVSIHAPMRGATGSKSQQNQQIVCFNPRPYARGDPVGGFVAFFYHVSIHAPMRGATAELAGGYAIINVSIHAPMRGATLVLH